MELDLRGIGLPLCLLKFKRVLLDMGPDDRLEVFIRDPAIVEDLARIARRSQGRTIRYRREEDHYRIEVGPLSILEGKPESDRPDTTVEATE